jgi:hypothetical protein
MAHSVVENNRILSGNLWSLRAEYDTIQANNLETNYIPWRETVKKSLSKAVITSG